jgi:hypothetical protein
VSDFTRGDVFDHDPDFNPYVAPKAGVSHPAARPDGDGRDARVWAEGNVLVLMQGAPLPDRCVKCNAPADGYRLRRNLSWHSPIWYLVFFLISPIVYVIAALIVRKKATVYVPLCETHLGKRNRALVVGWLGTLAGLAGLICGLMDERFIVLAAIGPVVMLVSLIFGVMRSQTLTPKRIDDRLVWLKGACSEFLAQLGRGGEDEHFLPQMKPLSYRDF